MAGFTLLTDIIAASKEFGVFDFYLPWLITFAIFWAILTKVKIFGDPFPDTGDAKKKGAARLARVTNLIVSLGASLYIMAYTPIGLSFSVFFSALFGGAFMIILTILAFVAVLFVVYSVSKGESPFEAGKAADAWKRFAIFAVIGSLVLVLAVYIFSSGTALFPGLTLPGFQVPSIPMPALPAIGLTMQDLAIIFLVVVTGLIIYYVTKSPKD